MLRRYDRGYRPYVRGYLDPEQLCGVAFGERLEPLPGPNHRTFRHLVHQPVPDPELAGERLDVGLRREKAVRSPFHDESSRRSVTTTPPARRSLSSTITSVPALISSHAADRPVRPAPTTTHVIPTRAPPRCGAPGPRAQRRATDRRATSRCARAGHPAAPRARGTRRRCRTRPRHDRTRIRSAR